MSALRSTLCHTGAALATHDEVYALAPPTYTKTWHPMGFADQLDIMHDAARVMQMKIIKEQYCLANHDKDDKGKIIKGTAKRMFGVWTIESGTADMGLALAFRGCYDKSMSAALAGGSVYVFNCANTMISGDLFRFMHKNTKNCLREFRAMAADMIGKSRDHYGDLVEEIETWKRVQLTQDQGYQILALADCHNVFKPVQYNRAKRQWNDPDQDDYLPRNLWSLYNAGTEALKKGDMRHMMSRLIDWHTYTRRVLADTTLPMVGTPLGQIWQGWPTTKAPGPDTPVIVDMTGPQDNTRALDLAEPAIIAPEQSDDTSERFRALELD